MGKGADLENGAPSFRFGKSRYTVVSLFLAAKRKNGRQAKVCVHYLVDFFYRVGPNKQTGVHSIELIKRHRRTETTQSRVGGWGGGGSCGTHAAVQRKTYCRSHLLAVWCRSQRSRHEVEFEYLRRSCGKAMRERGPRISTAENGEGRETDESVMQDNKKKKKERK